MGDGSLSQEEIDALLMGQEEPYLKIKKVGKGKPMTDILSQDEIDQLLSAISSGDADPRDYYPNQSKKVKIYDFSRPTVFTKENIRIIKDIHEVFSRLSSVSIQNMIKTRCDVHVQSVDQLRFDEFTRSIPIPSPIAEINADPLKGIFYLEIDPSISDVIIDLLCGGQGIPSGREGVLTNAEVCLLETLFVHLLGSLRESWSGILDLRPRLSVVDSDVGMFRALSPTQMGVLITFEIKILDTEGMMNLYIPEYVVKPLKEKLSFKSLSESLFESESAKLQNVQISLDEVGHLSVIKYKDEPLIELNQIANLSVGDFIPLKNDRLEITI